MELLGFYLFIGVCVYYIALIRYEAINNKDPKYNYNVLIRASIIIAIFWPVILLLVIFVLFSEIFNIWTD